MSQMNFAMMERAAGRAAGLMRSLANEHRLLLLCQLSAGERGVSELVEAVGLSQSAVSQHLARLRAEGLVATRREGQAIYYSLASDDVRRVIATLYAIYCPGGAARRDASSDALCRPEKTNPQPQKARG